MLRSGPAALVGLFLAFVLGLAASQTCAADAKAVLSFPPLRQAPPASARPLPVGPKLFVDAAKGDDAANGTEATPWRTVNHALKQVRAGDTLVLRGGTYYENVYCAAVGRQDAPVTVRCYPGEQAILDGGMREFFDTPAQSWTPFEGGAPGEFRSARPYRNLRIVMGSFGDSMVGLQTYYHAMDLRTASEVWDWEDWSKQKETDCKPLYCGPGVWYDADSGYIHARLAHTHIPDTPNYAGVTDPRQVPIVLASFRSTPLFLDGAAWVVLQDLVVRGAGHDAVVLDKCRDIRLENLTIWAGSYGLSISRTERLGMFHCGVYGNVAPWTFRSDTSKRDYPGRPNRNITRLNTHANIVIDAGREYSVYATPVNDDWEIAWCEFTDAHDGPYLGGVNLRFHHNLVDGTQDDGIYLSPMYPRYTKRKAVLHLYQNYISRVLTAFAFGGPEQTNNDQVFFYRNIVDLRRPIPAGRPTGREPKASYAYGKPFGDHGAPPWSAMCIYQNTFLVASDYRHPTVSVARTGKQDVPQRLFNNIFLTASAVPEFERLKLGTDLILDGNLYWRPGLDPAKAATHFDKFRASPAFAESRKVYEPGIASRCKVADPKFVKAGLEAASGDDFRLQPDSPAVDAGVETPAEWPDTLREKDAGKPDAGALPLGAPAPRWGRGAE